MGMLQNNTWGRAGVGAECYTKAVGEGLAYEAGHDARVVDGAAVVGISGVVEQFSTQNQC